MPVDVAFLGSRFILTEFSIGVFSSLGLACSHPYSNSSIGGIIIGTYLLCIGINYVPLLRHVIRLMRHGTARQEIADELRDKRRMFWKYQRPSLLQLGSLALPF